MHDYSYMHRDILAITEEILKLLSKEKELSTRQISLKIKTHRAVALKSLEFLKRIKMLEERKGTETNRIERLFSLKK
jgi:predicted transcriptional regulator